MRPRARVVVIDRYRRHAAVDRATLSRYSECQIEVNRDIAAAAANAPDLLILVAEPHPFAQLWSYRRVRPGAPASRWLLLVPRRAEALARRWAAPHGDRIATSKLDPKAIAAIVRAELGLPRRSSPRVPLGLMVRLLGPESNAGRRGRTLNVSGTGMLLSTTVDLDIGSEQCIALSVGNSPEPITLLARVLRRDEGAKSGPAYGLRFERLLSGHPQAFECVVGVPLRVPAVPACT